ncbi:MAG: hypothetical protein R3C10_08080 [Pirellulales bacterium]
MPMLTPGVHRCSRHLFGSLLLATVFVTVAGCGRRSDLPPLAPVYGKVTVGGEPLTFGTVALVPDRSKGTQGTMGVGPVQPDGSFRITTAGEDGGLVGHHLVRVNAMIEYDPVTNTPPHPVVHSRYLNERDSGLTFEVKADQDNELNLTLDPPE